MNTIKQYILLSFLVLLASCQSDDVLTETVLQDNSLRFSLNLEQQVKESTRSIIDQGEKEGENNLNENVIDKVQVLVFDMAGNKFWFPTQFSIGSDAIHSADLIVPIEDYTIYNEIEKQGNFKVYIFANTSINTASIQTEADLKKLTITENFNIKQPENFAMIGFYTGRLENKGVVTLNMKRKASKIEANFPKLVDEVVNVIIEGENTPYYLSPEEDAVKVRLVNYVNRANLVIESAIHKPNLESSKFYSLKKGEKVQFYSYARDWSTEESSPTQLHYVLKLKSEHDTDYQEFDFYINLQFEHEGKVNYLLQPNHYYELTPYIGTVKGEVTEPVVVSGIYKVKEWTTQEVVVEIKDAHYFVVKERELVLPNSKTLTIDFNSTTDVEIVEGSLKCWYNDLVVTQAEETENYVPRYGASMVTGSLWVKYITEVETPILSGENGYPTVTIDPETKKIEITADLPINYLPKEIEFIVRDELNFEEVIRITQYPARYITARNSLPSGKDSAVRYTHEVQYGNWDQNNFILYTVNTITGGDFIIGDPVDRRQSQHFTYPDEEHNKLVSPRFVIASQRSIYPSNTPYFHGKIRCSEYTEGGYPKGSWRMPTRAEIEYINSIQSDYNSAVKNLLKGRQYWSAQEYYYYDSNRNDFVKSNDRVGVAIRCVRDVY